MFQELQLSGILLCYGPLALVIFGFIGFALITDKIANRTYLRRLDPRPEIEQNEPIPYTITQPTQGLTPSGLVVTLLPEDKKQDNLPSGQRAG